MIIQRQILTIRTTFLVLLVAFFGFLVAKAPVLAQINQLEFGKNRVQFHRFFDDWSQYESESFITYWYGQGRFVGQSAAQMAELDYEEIQRLLDYRINEKLEVIIYSDLTDLHQSNIGSEETFNTQSGEVKVVGTKIFAYFNGDHTHLRRQVREGIAHVLVNAMIFGSNFQEVIQNSVSNSLPIWFRTGLVKFTAEEWTTDTDDKMRDQVQSKEFLKLLKKYDKKPHKAFNVLAAKDPQLWGRAFWYYIAYQFGKSNVSNLMYITRINRSLEDALLFVMDSDYKTTVANCLEFYQKRYEREIAETRLEGRPLQVKNKLRLPIFQPKLSPDGKKVAYVLNELGRWKVYIQDLSSKKRQLILKGGTRNPFQTTDENYPLLAWNPDNQRLFVAYERRDVLKLMEINVADGKKKIENFQPDFQRLYSIDFMNPRDLVLSASVRGMSDIFTYNTVGRTYKQISNDFWDDLDVVSVNLFNRKGVLFTSNRLNERLDPEKQDSVVPINKFDIFWKDLEDTSRALVRITATPESDERQPIAIDSTFFSFLSEESGIVNRELGFLKEELLRTDTLFFTTNAFREVVPMRVMQDSARLFPDSLRIDSFQIKEIFKKVPYLKNTTNTRQGFTSHHSAPRVGKFLSLSRAQGLSQISTDDIRLDSATTPSFTRFWEWKKQIKILAKRAQRKAKVGVKPDAPKTQQQAGRKPQVLEGKPTIMTPTSNEPIFKIPKLDTVSLVSNSVDTTSKPVAQKPKKKADNYYFQSEFDEPDSVKTKRETIEKAASEAKTSKIAIAIVPNDSTPTALNFDENSAKASFTEGALVTNDEKKVFPFRSNRVAPYRLKFRNDNFTTRLDNNLLFGGLDSYAGTPQGFTTPPLGLLMKGNFKDLLEDYQLEGGVRVPLSFNGYEAFMFFDDRKQRIDKRYAIYHRSTRPVNNLLSSSDGSRSRTQTSLGQVELRYPFDAFQRLQLTSTLRFDRFTQLATDSLSLVSPNVNEQRIGAKVEYVFDNALSIDANLRVGTRVKVWFDFVKRFNAQVTDSFSFKFNNGYMGIFNLDARHYERVLTHSVLALRAAGALSFGDEKTLFYLGGIDNQLWAGYDENVSVPVGNYAFETLAANMRGFQRNARNGSSYALINAELRVPIFKYFSSKPISSNFWRNFQLVGFFDAGTAWHGRSPFSRENPLNTLNVTNGAVSLRINYFKDPIVSSYGTGVRMMLFGYLIRADYAWGIDTRTVLKPRWHLAIGTDF
jgi:hypothetical protein